MFFGQKNTLMMFALILNKTILAYSLKLHSIQSEFSDAAKSREEFWLWPGNNLDYVVTGNGKVYCALKLKGKAG